ncbi:MAG: FAD:protein FMN transferase [Bacilli bacterium]
MKNRFKYLSILLCSSALVSCADKVINKGEWLVVSHSSASVLTSTNFQVVPFNTVMTLKYFKNEKKTYEDNFDQNIKTLFVDQINSLHKKFDRHYNYKDESENIITSIKVINDSYGSGSPIKCDDELYALLKIGYNMTLETNGYFNFFVGNLNSFWDDIFYNVLDEGNDVHVYDPYYSETQKIEMEKYACSTPTLDEVQTLFTFNDEAKEITFNTIDNKDYNGTLLERNKVDSKYRPVITTGGIAKGLAVDFIKEKFLSLNYTDAVINAGSSSLASVTAPTFFEKGYQKFSFADPRKGGSIVREIAFSLKVDYDYGISTSGNYNQKSYYINIENDNKLYRHHIVNPYTGECSQEHSSVTIISKTFSNAELDALSTMFVNLPLDQCFTYRDNLLSKYPDKDLSLIIMDTQKDDSLNIYIDSILKDDIKVETSNCKVYYE